MNILTKLFDATVKTISRPLASSLIKGGASYPKFRQATIKMGQKFYDNPVDEELAMQTTVHYLVQSTMIGAAWITIYYQIDGYFDRRRQRVLVADQAMKQSREEMKKTEQEYDRLLEEILDYRTEQEYDRLLEEILDYRLRRNLGGHASKTTYGTESINKDEKS